MYVRCLHILVALSALACGPNEGVATAVEEDSVLEREEPVVTLPEPTMRRLTQAQYQNAIRALLGEDLVLPTSLEPDEVADGLLAIGAALTTISPRGVEQYETAAYSLATQAMENEAVRDELVPCDADEVGEDACAETVLATFGSRAWRRPLSQDELDVLVDLSGEASAVLDGFDAGLVYGLAAILQSPNFLFRVELGEPDPDSGERRFTGYEMASKLSFFLWNTIPDEALMVSAELGELTEDEGLLAQVDRMMADPRFEAGLREFFADMLSLHQLDGLNKDPTVFTHMSPEVGPSAREETLLGVLDNVWVNDGDYRDIFTTTTTFLDRKLASIYSVRAPAREGFAPTTLSDEGGRRGLLGQVSFLAMNSHPVSTSATLRGQFVREVLLCQYIPPPPSDVDTSIPEPSASARTLRERVAVHLEDQFCAGCHRLTDPIGLGFEQFDGLGHFRTREEGAVIDPSGELDESPFTDAWGLSDRIANHPALTSCFTRTLMAYGSGHSVTDGEEEALAYLNEGFQFMDHSVQFLIRDLVMSPAFRMAGDVQ